MTITCRFIKELDVGLHGQHVNMPGFFVVVPSGTIGL